METGRSGPEAGWFPDPRGTFEERWWDGAAWTERVRERGRIGLSPSDATPADDQELLETLREMAAATGRALGPTSAPRPPIGPPPATGALSPLPPPGPPSTSTAAMATGARAADAATTTNLPLWLLVSLPAFGVLCGFIIEQTRPGGLAVAVLLLAIFTGPVWIALLDLNVNPQIVERSMSGKGSLVALALFFAPAYLWTRQQALGQARWPAAAYLIAALLALALVPDTAPGAVVDGPRLEAAIEEWAAQARGTASHVECPTREPLRAGHAFDCAMFAFDQEIVVRVEVVNDEGDVRWELIG